MGRKLLDIVEAEALLGLSVPYDAAAARRAYSEQIRLCHPDVAAFHGMDKKEGAARTVLLNEAYGVVKSYIARVGVDGVVLGSGGTGVSSVGFDACSSDVSEPCADNGEEFIHSDFVSVSESSNEDVWAGASDAYREAADAYDAAVGSVSSSESVGRPVSLRDWLRSSSVFPSVARFVERFPFGIVLFLGAFIYVILSFGGFFWLEGIEGVREPSGVEFVLWYLVVLPVLFVNLFVPVITERIRSALIFLARCVIFGR